MFTDLFSIFKKVLESELARRIIECDDMKMCNERFNDIQSLKHESDALDSTISELKMKLNGLQDTISDAKVMVF